eukprot:gb/GECH01006768.1/.p1 GENE.gb/GECH01006768.1/~~gb/GECH01006768.1/.p1  ORF type:complete len:484 (+),score=133.13 gb/GECH01006768.1/:1-1452(+)
MLRYSTQARTIAYSRTNTKANTLNRHGKNHTSFALHSSTISRHINTHKNVPPDGSDWWATKKDVESQEMEKESWGDGYDENWEWYYQQLYRTIPKEYEEQSNYDKSSWVFNRAPIPTQKPTQWFENNLREWKLGKWMEGFTELMNKRMRAPKFSRRPVNPIPKNMEHLISYKNFKFLVQFLSPGGQILGTRYTGVRPKLQKKLSKEIKKARFLGLIPFTGNPFYDPSAEPEPDIEGAFQQDQINDFGRALEDIPTNKNPEKFFDEYMQKHGIQREPINENLEPAVLSDGRFLFRSNDSVMAVTDLMDDYGDELKQKEGIVARAPRPLEDRSDQGPTPKVGTVPHFDSYAGYQKDHLDTYPSDLMKDITLEDDTDVDQLLKDESNLKHAEEFDRIGFFESTPEEEEELYAQAERIDEINKEAQKEAEEELQQYGLSSRKRKTDEKQEEGGIDLAGFDKEDDEAADSEEGLAGFDDDQNDRSGRL